MCDIAVRSGRCSKKRNSDGTDDDDGEGQYDDVDVGDPYRGLYAVPDWSNQLSFGEQQHVTFGRLLVNRPSLVILEEAIRKHHFRIDDVLHSIS